ncbi:MAG: PAS domain S-box protein [Anaerolineales bacterium]|nr:PAS domain S-box protein [Anaerolineales bacterium]
MNTKDTDSSQEKNRSAALAAILNSVADGILVVSLEGKIVFMNPQFIKMWSIPEDVTDALEALKIAYPQTKTENGFFDLVQSIYTHPKKRSYDLVELKDGRVFELFSIPQIVDGEIIGRVWTYRDVTEQKQTERALRESETRYRELLTAERRHIQELKLLDKVRSVLSQELELPIVFRRVVEAIAETFGYNLVSIYMLEDGVLKLQHQIGYHNVIETIAISSGVSGQVVRTGQPILLKDVSERKDFLGAIEGIVSEICVPLVDAGHVIGFINVESTNNIQLTEEDLNLMVALSEHISIAINRAKLYTKLWQQEAQYRKLFELAPIGMGITKRDGDLKYVNQSFANTLGYEPHELEQKNLREITYADDLTKNLELIDQLYSYKISNYSLEKRYIRKDGSLAPVSLQVSMLPNIIEEEEEPSMIAQIVDLSELKQAEEVLRQAQKMESLGIMAGGIAHDFNNLLVAMIGQSSLSLKKLDDNKVDQAAVHMQKALTAAERAAALTRQLLAYSGKGKFEIRPVNLNDIVLENYHLFEVALPKNIKIETILDQKLPPIEADSSQIQQIIMNLLLNAADAIGEHAGQITISTNVIEINQRNADNYLLDPQHPLTEGHYVRFTVADDGMGIPPEVMSQIFDPFYTTKERGHGLGLAAVLGIVRGHRGGIHVESILQQGTTFDLIFPISLKQITPPQPEPFETPTSLTPHNITQSILIIDDEEDVRQTLTHILETEGVPIFAADNGRTGLELYKQNRDKIALVILDLSMPDMNGAEVFEKLRAENEQIPIILSSGYSESEATRPFIGQGLADFLQKPYTATNLLTKIKPYLETV